MASKPLFVDARLHAIWDKLLDGLRLTLEDVRILYASPDLLGVGWMAKQVKERRYGKQAFYVLNRKLEPTNICVLSCKFCDFAAKRGQPSAYEMTIDQMVESCSGDISEIHISGGMPPEWKLDHYLKIVRSLRQAYPEVGIKAFTAVEIEWAARISSLSIEAVLRQLQEAGLTALPGGGAEVFSERVRQELFPFKIGAKEWLDVHRTAHRLGIPSNATLLYGHIETPEERWRHLEMLRQLQDESLFGSSSPAVVGGGSINGIYGSPTKALGDDGKLRTGFMSFIPLAFQPGTTGLAYQPPTVQDDLKLLAISRLYLDNIPHIKAYWITLGEETASTGLHFGADDIDGTIGEEKIMHAAGAASPTLLARERLQELIREAGCEPVERDALYNPVSEYRSNGVTSCRDADTPIPPYAVTVGDSR
jgi:aminodeoxyfutalosine synthase